MYLSLTVRPVTVILRSILITLCLVGGAIAAEPVPADPVPFDIGQQPLRNALTEFARQSDRELLFSTDVVEDKVANHVDGIYEPEVALELLLADTGLEYSVTSYDTILVAEEKGLSGPGNAPTTPRPVMMAQASRKEENTTEGKEEENDVSPGSRESEDLKMEEIVVTGTNIRGVQTHTVPVTVLDKSYIDSTGISSAARLIESLPQNFALQSQSSRIVPGSSDATTQGATINLRGIGEGTTLVLLNGRRMALGYGGSAVDISALPLSAVERVEILTDGASAIYGSDAIGGVVNFILRRDFNGAETAVRTGWAAGGVNEYRASQIFGKAWDSGNALVSAEFYKRDLLAASKRDFVPATSLIGSLFPRDENYSVAFVGRQDLTQTVSAFSDVLYTHRDSDNIGFISREENNLIKNSQLTATGGFNWQAGQAWEVEASGSYGRNDLHRLSNSILFGTNGALINDVLFEVGAAEVKADGPTYALPGGDMYVAIGAGWRSESLKSVPSFANGTGNPGNPLDFDQTVRSVFGEVLIPIIGPANHSGGVERLELSLAGRYDDYSRFGSSFDPRAGLLWEPKRGLRLRGSYGTSFAAPKLADYNLASTRGFAIVQPDPLGPGGVSRQLLLLGTDVAGLGPQQSKSWSVGIEVEPERITGLQFGMNYYNIRYRDRIAAPQPTTVILANPASFGSLFIRDPSLAQINEYIALAQLGGNPLFALFDPTTVDAIVDGRRRNLSATATSGLDFSAQYTFAAGESEFNFGLNATYIFELEQQITEASAPFDSVATYFNPPHARARSAVGWHRQSWSANMFVNYTDSYTDNRFETMPVPVSSYTTVDLRVAYESGEGIRSDFWSGVSVSLNAQNLFDQDPPRTAIIRPDSDSGFDPTNANPLGRFVAIELVKKW